MRLPALFSVAFLGLACAVNSSAFAHFPWLQVEDRQSESPRLECYFSEAPTEDDPALLKYVDGAKAWRIPSRGDAKTIELKKTDSSLGLDLSEGEAEDLYGLTHQLGVMQRGETAFLLNYYAKTGPAVTGWTWRNEKSADLLALDIRPDVTDGQLTLTVLFDGKPAAGAEVVFYNDLVELEETAKSDDKGQVTIDLSKHPIDAVRVKYVQDSAGTQDDKEYSEVRHYLTATFPRASYQPLKTASDFPVVPETVTSFGAAFTDGKLYVYGGHTGSAHHYSNEGQANTLHVLDLANKTWSEAATGPKLQGLAMVTHGGKLYRLGGFTAKNEEGEDHDLWSQTSFASFDLATQKWTDLAPLPERRSSFDAAVLDDKIYVVGGWALQGEEGNEWRETAWTWDLNAKNPEWTAIPNPPFTRRALSLAAYQGKIYAIGGMQETGGPTTRTAIYDPKTEQWTEGPRLIGSSMTGFGTSSFAVGDRLYVSTYDGTLQTLAKDGKSWELQGNLPNARFFHRMVPIDDQHLIFVGGSNMQSGKFEEVEVLKVQ